MISHHIMYCIIMTDNFSYQILNVIPYDNISFNSNPEYVDSHDFRYLQKRPTSFTETVG